MAPRRQVSRLPAEQRINDIMQAAREVFIEKGYGDALISDIAERAGVVEGSIYRYFTNKRDLLLKVVENWYEGMLARDLEAFAGVSGIRNQLRFLIHHHLVSIKRDPTLSRLVFQELRPDPNYRQTKLFQLNQSYTHRIIDVVRAGIESGELRADISPSLVRDMVYGCVEHHTWAFLRKEGDFDVETTADGIAAMIYRGMAAASDEIRESAAAQSGLDSIIARLERIADRLDR